jgi:hypothetical protein
MGRALVNKSFLVAMYYAMQGFTILRQAYIDTKDLAFLSIQRPDDKSKMSQPYIYGNYYDGSVVPYMFTMQDMFAEDWMIGKIDSTGEFNVYETNEVITLK